jgi:ABC-type transport system involved in multi-copper enzyme maturation permease subunit
VKAFVADLRRSVLAPASIATLLLAVLLAALLSAPSGSTGGPDGGSQFAMSYEYDHGFVFQFYIFNATGQPVSGALIRVDLSQGNSSTSPIVSNSATTGPDGLATVTAPVNDSNWSATVYVWTGYGYQVNGGLGVSTALPGTMVRGPGTFTQILGGRYGLTPEILLFDPGPGGSVPTGSVVVVRANYSGPPAKDEVLSSEPVTSPVSRYSLAGSSLPLSANQIEFNLVGPDGSTIAQWAGPPTELAETSYTSTSWGSALDARATLWGFLAPLLAVGFGYAAYARPRASRALEPILALATTRLGVLARRYLSAAIPLVAATGLAVLIEFQVEGPDPTGLSPALLGAIWGSLALEGAAFLGIVFLLAHLLRSAATVAAITIALDAFLAFFLTAATYLLADFTRRYTDPALINAEVFDSPTHFSAATIGAYFAGLGSPEFPVHPPIYGGGGGPALPLPIPTFELVLAMTIVIAAGSILLAAWLAKYRD